MNNCMIKPDLSNISSRRLPFGKGIPMGEIAYAIH
jgi:hypothetical protein